jgi:hypothetical protein
MFGGNRTKKSSKTKNGKLALRVASWRVSSKQKRVPGLLFSRFVLALP